MVRYMTKVSVEEPVVKHLTNPLLGRPQPLGDVMREAHRVLVSHLDGALDAAGYSEVRSAHVSVLATLHPDGSRLSELVDRGGRTKQATAQLAGHLVTAGYAELVPDPSDGRAKHYVPTAAAYALLAECQDIVTAYEQWLEDVVGPDGLVALRAILTTIVEGNGPRSTPRGQERGGR
jgi:DNA-binding MarR family transcriptional regulator